MGKSGTNGESDVPAELTDVKAIAAGDSFSLALKSDGTVVAWGYGGYNGTNVPVGLTGVTAISASWETVLALVGGDTVAPTLVLPSTLKVDATSEEGAPVTYTVTATDPDNQQSDLAITCTPVSGSVFSIGTTTVNCTASDPAGNTNSGSFQIVVVVNAPTSKDQCKKGGWQNFIYPSFKNQGDCVSYVNH